MADSEEEFERKRKDKMLRVDRTELINISRRLQTNDEVKARRDEWGGNGNGNDRNGGGKSPSPAKPNSWQIWNQGANKHSDGGAENDPSSAHPPVHIDVFQEREGGGGMRVGRDYQAKVPNVIPEAERNVQGENDRALLVWKPTEKLTDDEIESYISMAKEKFQYTGEQALGLLYWHRYDIQRATQDLGNFTPHPEEWTIEDKVLFEQAFQFHGKSFDKIRQMLPDKSMSSLIRYYYNWKKHKNKSSVMDRQVKKLSQEDEDSVPGTNGSGVMSIQNNNISNLHHPHSIGMLQDSFHSESDDEKQISETARCCGNCGVPCTEVYTKENLCNTCFIYWKNTGDSRPLTGPLRRGDKNTLGGLLRQRRSPPKGMNINHDDLSMLARSQPQAENVILQGLEKEVLDMKCRIQTVKQRVELCRRGLPDEGVSHLRPREGLGPSSCRVNSRWTQDELMLAAQGIRRYGKNFQKIAEVIGTKTEVHIKSFYANYRRRYGLENLIQEHQLENADDELDDNMQLIDNNQRS